ncbi:MAG: hypothetical protein V2I45_05705, partial [Halieaceae bacterium]|nr:hypothetical protein [Halieaceae bacterium]
DDADVDELRSALEAAANGRYQVLDQEILSARGVEMSATTPDLIIETAPPAIFRNQLNGDSWVGGTHGYPATEIDDMAAFLIGAGPAFKTGVVIPEIQQIDVYPVAARVLGISPLQPLPSDGGALNQAMVDAPKGP